MAPPTAPLLTTTRTLLRRQQQQVKIVFPPHRQLVSTSVTRRSNYEYRSFSSINARSMTSSSSSSSGSTNTAPFPLDDLPTVEQFASDPFMKQVSYAGRLVPLLSVNSAEDELQNEISRRLQAQLSHSDGVRGFFVTYLTGSSSSSADDPSDDQDEIPILLVKALAQTDPNELVPLACMNVVMPTGMITMHTDPQLSQASTQTAQRGQRILQCLANMTTAATTVSSTEKEEEEEGDNEKVDSSNSIAQMVQRHCRAIGKVAKTKTGEHNNDEGQTTPDDAQLVDYWTSFFEKWGYQTQQCHDIAAAIESITFEQT